MTVKKTLDLVVAQAIDEWYSDPFRLETLAEILPISVLSRLSGYFLENSFAIVKWFEPSSANQFKAGYYIPAHFGGYGSAKFGQYEDVGFPETTASQDALERFRKKTVRYLNEMYLKHGEGRFVIVAANPEADIIKDEFQKAGYDITLHHMEPQIIKSPLDLKDERARELAAIFRLNVHEIYAGFLRWAEMMEDGRWIDIDVDDPNIPLNIFESYKRIAACAAVITYEFTKRARLRLAVGFDISSASSSQTAWLLMSPIIADIGRTGLLDVYRSFAKKCEEDIGAVERAQLEYFERLVGQ